MHELVIAMKSVRIIQYLASDTNQWLEDKEIQQQQLISETNETIMHTCACTQII